MKDNYILTAESVTEGHPDKLCDTIADAVVDACLKHDPSASCGLRGHGHRRSRVHRGRRDHRHVKLPDIPAIICKTVAASRIWR